MPLFDQSINTPRQRRHDATPKDAGYYVIIIVIIAASRTHDIVSRYVWCPWCYNMKVNFHAPPRKPLLLFPVNTDARHAFDTPNNGHYGYI